jgi:NAD+ kinase
VKIGIFAKADRLDFAPSLREALHWLERHDCRLLVDERVIEPLGLDSRHAVPSQEIARVADLLVVFGGDGTLLGVARLLAGRRAPILGVNLGTLGFLSGATIEELYPALEALLSGSFRLDTRSMVRAEVRQGRDQICSYHALNDAVINKGALGRMISLEVRINGDFTSQFLADGLIISTPTGSTAYSLSAGGPIIYPALAAITLTPICPHTLTHRPLVIPAEREVTVILKGGDDVTLTIDGQVGAPLQLGAEVTCTQSEYHVDLVQPTDRSFFDVLRQKLKWGERWNNK